MTTHTIKYMWIFLISAISVTRVLAGEDADGGDGGAPDWFPMLEVAGVILGLLISGLAFKVYLGMQGGMIGEGFKFVVLGIISMTVGIGAHGINELSPFISEFGAELTLELAIYLGLMLIGMGVYKVSKVA